MTNKKILIVDNEPDIITINEALLRGAGYDVDSERNYTEAFRRCKEQEDKFSLLLIGVDYISHTSAIELANSVKNHNPNLPIVANTSEYEKEMREAGANYVVERPFHNNVFLETIGKAVRGE